MQRRSLWASTSGFLLAAAGIGAAHAETGPNHRMTLHVGSGDAHLMGVALNNIAAAVSYYADKGQTVAIELVANGPGYTMLRADTSPVKADIAATKQKYPFVVFSACQNSRRGAAKAEGKAAQDIPEVPEATDVAAGVVRLTELQEQGFRYIRV